MVHRRTFIASLGALAASRAAGAQAPDHLAPKTPTTPPIVGPLHTVTIITPDLPALAKLYRDGMGMELSGPIAIDVAVKQALATAWGIPADLGWTMHMLRRPKVPLATQIRVIVTDKPTPAIRQSWNRQEPGPYGMGFPNDDVAAWDKHVLGLGFTRATPEIERFPLKRPDGSGYEVQEATFNGPEFLRAIAISRRDGMAQVGDVDPVTKRGGPAYATQVITDMDAMVKFFTDVLDFEVRSDRMWRAYEVPFRFATLYSKGAKNGHVALAQYEPKDTVPGTGVLPAPPNRGMAIWSFQAESLAKIEARAKANGVAIAGRHDKVDVPDLGPRRAIAIHAPNGFLIEIFEKA
ncbi:MAG: VOC family protein [Rhodospirillaceae bacterium]|nr:VOC family protein [Rhodospirillaceae bacterium]